MRHRLLLPLMIALVACDSIFPPTEPKGDVAWETAERPLGRGYVLARNSLRTESGFELRLEPQETNGGQFRTGSKLGNGVFEAEIRCARATGSLCAFFLYEDRQGLTNDEIDVEIYNDGSRRVLLVTWVGGELTNHSEVILPFDPASAHHTYRIDRTSERVVFSVDGVRYATFTSRLPRQPMHVFLNAWYPRWLEPGEADAPFMTVRDVTLPR